MKNAKVLMVFGLVFSSQLTVANFDDLFKAYESVGEESGQAIAQDALNFSTQTAAKFGKMLQAGVNDISHRLTKKSDEESLTPPLPSVEATVVTVLEDSVISENFTAENSAENSDVNQVVDVVAVDNNVAETIQEEQIDSSTPQDSSVSSENVNNVPAPAVIKNKTYSVEIVAFVLSCVAAMIGFVMSADSVPAESAE